MLGLRVEVRGRDKPETDQAGGKSNSGAAKESKRWHFGDVTDGDSGLRARFLACARVLTGPWTQQGPATLTLVLCCCGVGIFITFQ